MHCAIALSSAGSVGHYRYAWTSPEKQWNELQLLYKLCNWQWRILLPGIRNMIADCWRGFLFDQYGSILTEIGPFALFVLGLHGYWEWTMHAWMKSISISQKHRDFLHHQVEMWHWIIPAFNLIYGFSEHCINHWFMDCVRIMILG